MKLTDIIARIKVKAIEGNSDVEITDVDIDSRRVASGHLFVAMRGTLTDGHQYIGKAIEQGAAAVVCEHIPAAIPVGQTTFVVVDSTEEAAGPILLIHGVFL